MRTRYALAFLCTTVILSPSSACVDYWTPPAITVTVEIDASFTEALITVHNLNLFGGPNGAFCSCAVTTWTNMFSDLQYIAFVDSGTYNPVPGFAVWDASASAASAWGNLQPGDWNAYIAEVVAPGINTGTPVELLIRATLPPGYTYNMVDSSVTYASLGTDEWSVSGNDLAFSHNSLGSFVNSTIVIEFVTLDFFDLVDDLVTSTPETEVTGIGSLLVRQGEDGISVSLPSEDGNMELRCYDALGRILLQRAWNGAAIRLEDMGSGLLVIEVRNDRERIVRKLAMY